MTNRDMTGFWLSGVACGVCLGMILCVVFDSPFAHASHTNERADPSIWIDPKPTDDGYVYREDACVEALRGAMERMEPFIPTQFKKDGNLWHTSEFLTVDGMQEREEAHREWEEAKLMCWRR